MSRRVYQPHKDDDPYDLDGGPPKWRWHEPTGYIFFKAWGKVGKNETLTGTDFRVLFGLLSCCDWGNICPCSYGELGQAIGLARQNVSTSVQHLVRARLVLCERQGQGKKSTITLSPYLCWKGRPWHLARARQDFLARWRLQHGGQGQAGVPSPSHSRCEDEASPGVGENARGEDPFILQQALEILSSS